MTSTYIPTSQKLELFQRIDLKFKTINEHALQTTILIPKSLLSKPRAEYAIIVNWHGGGFVVGDRMYDGWIPPWLLDICLTTPAIFITPDYRLLPESNTSEILTDVKDFWSWLHAWLSSVSSSTSDPSWPYSAIPSPKQILCSGQSSGGYIAVQSALVFPHLSRIKMLIAMGSPLYTDFGHYRIPSPRKILGKLPPPSHKAEKIVRSYVKSVEKGSVRTTGDVVEMWEFLTCVLQQAYIPRWLGKEGSENWEIMKLLEKAEEFPPIWVIQGEEDSVVVPICSTGFVEGLKKSLPGVPVLLTLQLGDHSFEVKHNITDAWVQEGLEFVRKYWP